MAVRRCNTEKIGNISLNISYYSGQDSYNDGDAVENGMLETAKMIAEESEDDIQMLERFNQNIFEEKDWAVLYHFSHIRGNIIEPLELDKSMHVLEIGSGCGAVTGKLAEKVKKVTCIELSKRRSLINAYKNYRHDNIEIIVGNFQEIEKDLEKYDVITMIGVFEYAETYIQAVEPYRAFLQLAVKHLLPDGKLVLAIENKLGMKYFSGCKEDHTGIFFEGIEGYTGEKGVKTFSKKELSELLMEVGFQNNSYYYPYPDYKLPFSFYSDERLPEAGELFMNQRNFDNERLFLFDEMKAYQSMISAGLYREFSNSFLLEAKLSEPQLSKNHYQVIYKKCSNDRDFKYAVFTDICQNQFGDRKVIKYSMNCAGNGHLKHMYAMGKKMAQIFRGSRLEICYSEYRENMIVMKYIFGETFEKNLDDLISLGKIHKAQEELMCFIGNLKSMATEKFYVTEEYKSFFGENYPEQSMGCMAVTNIDLIPSNLFCENGKWIVVDYEWSFDFPIPVEFIIYRIMIYFINSSDARKKIKTHDFFVFSPEEEAVFEHMEREFQDSICRKIVPIERLYRVFGKAVYSPLVKVDELQSQVCILSSEKENLTQKITEQENENEALTQKIFNQKKEKEILNQKFKTLNDEKFRLLHEIENLNIQVDSLKVEYNRVLQERDWVLNSTIWKITKPVRSFLDLIKGIIVKRT